MYIWGYDREFCYILYNEQLLLRNAISCALGTYVEHYGMYTVETHYYVVYQ